MDATQKDPEADDLRVCGQVIHTDRRHLDVIRVKSACASFTFLSFESEEEQRYE